MGRRLATVLTLAATLAACGERTSGGNATAAAPSPSASAAPAATRDGFQPGAWVAGAGVTSVNLPGAPRAAVDRVRTALQRSIRSNSYCVTPAQAAEPPLALFTNKDSGDCRYEHMTMRGGRADGAVICSRPMRADPSRTTSMRMQVGGSYTPTTYDFDVAMTFDVPDRPGGSATMHIRGQRVGACLTPAG